MLQKNLAIRCTINQRVRHGVAAAILFAALTPANSNAIENDKALDALIDANQPAQVERIALERITKNAKDEQAYQYLAISALQSDAKKRSSALTAMDACITQLPQSSTCHLQAGRLLGLNVMEAGVMSALGSVGRIKAYFLKAVELDSKSFEARRDLMQFYLQAPGVVGGSLAKAREVAQAAAAYSADHNKLLNASVAIYEKKFDQAEQFLASVKPAGNEAMTEYLDDAWIALGFGQLGEKANAKAKAIFERMVNDNPKRANAYFFLGRAQLELSDWDAAIGSFKTAAQLDKSGSYATDYRLGVAYQGKGDKVQAKAAYERALKWPRLSEDARKQVQKKLLELGV